MKELSKKRQQRFDKREKKKAIGAMYKEYITVSSWSRRRYGRQTYIELDEPMRRGFKRNLVLKQSAYRRADVDVLLAILAFIDVEYHSSTRKFKATHYYPNRPHKREFIHESKTLNEREWGKIDEKYKPYFDKRRHISHWNGSEYFTYNFALEHFLESKLSKWFITKVPVLDPDADSRYAELRNKMYGPEQIERQHYRFRSRYSNWGYDEFAHTKQGLQEKQDWRDALVDAADYVYELSHIEV